MTVGKKEVDRWESQHLIGKKAKQKKTLERQDEVTTFCLTVNEKDTQQRKKLQVKGTTQATSENNASEQLYTVIYWHNVKKVMQIEEVPCWIAKKRSLYVEAVISMQSYGQANEIKPFKMTANINPEELNWKYVWLRAFSCQNK